MNVSNGTKLLRGYNCVRLSEPISGLKQSGMRGYATVHEKIPFTTTESSVIATSGIPPQRKRHILSTPFIRR
jgi:hypothetical protein